jgi:hypothetical protein
MLVCNDLPEIFSAKILQTKGLEVKIFIPNKIAPYGTPLPLVSGADSLCLPVFLFYRVGVNYYAKFLADSFGWVVF